MRAKYRTSGTKKGPHLRTILIAIILLSVFAEIQEYWSKVGNISDTWSDTDATQIAALYPTPTPRLMSLRPTLEPCGDEVVINWLSESASIMESFDYSLDSAKVSYEAQDNIATPECFQQLQTYWVNFYYYTWKAEVALSEGDETLAQSFADKAMKLLDSIDAEADRLEVIYGFDK